MKRTKGASEDKLKVLAGKLQYTFENPNLLRAALTHRSTGALNNERLEFLGDSILNFSIAAELYNRFPKAREGDLTRMRARLVRGETLAEIAKELGLGDYLNLGAGELKTGGYQRDSILADALEAIIGAMYLDSHLESCRTHILAWYEERLNAILPGAIAKDAKTRLQEILQAQHLPLPEYQIIEVSGDAHNPLFRVQCFVVTLKEPIFGTATTRRRAEQMAAEIALKALSNG